MTVHAYTLVTADTVAAGRFARHGSQELNLRRCRLVVVAMVTVLGGKLAAIRMEVVHVAHLDLLDALFVLPVCENWWVDTPAFLVVT